MITAAAMYVAPRLVHLSAVDAAIIIFLIFYFGLVLTIGFYLQRRANTGEDFFMAGREMTAWIAGLSFLSANLGSLELMGWAASAYQYGILATRWYWIGAIPAMLFLGIVMMPFYYISKTHSVPGYLRLRFGESSRALSAISFAFMTVLMSGISMYSMALVMKVVLGWNINFSIWVSSLTVAAYVALGGLRSAIFNEVLQFILIWAGALLIPVLGLVEAGGWSNLKLQIARNASAEYTQPVVDIGIVRQQPDGDSLDWHRVRPGVCDLVWLLDNGFFGGAAGACREGSSLGEAAIDHRRSVQDAGPVHRDPPRPSGAGGAADKADRRDNGGGYRRPQLQRSPAADAGALLWAGAFRLGNHGIDCGLYVRHGGKRERVYDSVDL